MKPPASGASTPSTIDGTKKEEKPAVPVDGIIGQLEIHQSGVVKMRLENGILLDVSLSGNFSHAFSYYGYLKGIFLDTTGDRSDTTFFPPTCRPC